MSMAIAKNSSTDFYNRLQNSSKLVKNFKSYVVLSVIIYTFLYIFFQFWEIPVCIISRLIFFVENCFFETQSRFFRIELLRGTNFAADIISAQGFAPKNQLSCLPNFHS